MFISINRLDEANFNINLDQIFTQSSNNPNQSVKRSVDYSELSVNRLKKLSTEGTVFNLDDYLVHTYWSNTYFHRSTFELPEVIDGMHVITHTLNSYNTHALGNLYEVVGGMSSFAKDLADWAVDNLKMVDTWINYRGVEYLLHYDQINDVVELYSYYTYESIGLISFDKISIYFNHNNEEVIEFWTTQKYTMGDYRGVTLYYNSVAARDFNYYEVYLDENSEPTDQVFMRGINLNQYGFYEYYENNVHMIAGEYGWYTVGAVVDHVSETVDVSPRHELNVYTPDGFSNVISYYKMNNEFKLKLYLPSFDGLTGLLVEEGKMIEVNQDSAHTQEMLLGYGFELMPNRYEVNQLENPVVGFQTIKGRFLTSDNQFTNITIDRLSIDIGPEGIRGNDRYYNYFGVLEMTIHEDNLMEATMTLSNLLTQAGLTYKYGSTESLFLEANQVYENYETYGTMLRFTNNTVNNPNPYPNPYVSYEAYQNNFDYIYTCINQIIDLSALVDLYPHIQYGDMNQEISLHDIVFFDLTQYHLTEINMTNATLDTSQLDLTMPRSPLLQNNQLYTIVYTASSEFYTEIIGYEEPVTYLASPLYFDGNPEIEIPNHLQIGNYVISAFFAKVTPTGFIRLSNQIPLKFNTFETVEFSINTDIEGVTQETRYLYTNHNATIESFYLDHLPPVVHIENIGSFSGEGIIDNIIVRGHMNVIDLLNQVTATDNYDPNIIIDYRNIYYEGVMLQSLTDNLLPGSYEIVISDHTGNETRILINQIDYLYEVKFYGLDQQLLSIEYVTTGQEVTEPFADIYTELEFMGWDTDLTNITSDLDVRGIYQLKIYVDITFMVDDEVYLIMEHIQAETPLIYPETPTKPLHEFAGWYVEGEDLPYENETVPSSNLVLFGKWIQVEYQINLDVDGGYLEGDGTAIVPYLEHFTLPVPTLEGVPFRGWFYMNKQVTNHNGHSLLPWSLTGDVTLIAVYYIAITSYEDLTLIEQNLSGRYKVINPIDVANQPIKPIGTINQPFTGIFDGGRYLIKNIKITSNNTYNGLFVCNAGTITNLVLENVTFENIINTNQSPIVYVGAIAAVNKGTISNSRVINTLTINRTGAYTQYYLGGLIGYQDSTEPLSGNQFNGLLINNNPSSSQIEYIGGIIGFAGSDVELNNTTVILKYTNTLLSGSHLYIGGVIGKASTQATIETLVTNVAIVSIQSIELSTLNFGGVVGISSGKVDINNARVLTNINERTKAMRSILGGFVASANRLTINNSQARVSIYKICIDDVNKNPRRLDAGGVVGVGAEVILTNTTIESNIYGNTRGYYQAQVFVGSIAGSTNILNVSYVVTSGSVKGEAVILTSETSSYGLVYVGGFVGQTRYASIFHSRSTALVDANATLGNALYSKSYAGGLIGVVTTSAQVNGSYTKASVSAKGPNGFAGGIVGYGTGAQITNSVSESNVTGTITGGIAGYLGNGKIDKAYSAGIIKGTNISGGLVGNLSSSIISNAFSLATVHGNNNAGHLTGIATSLTISNSYRTATQVVTTNTQTVTSSNLGLLPSSELMTLLVLRPFVSLEHLIVNPNAVWVMGTNGYPKLHYMA